MRATSFRSTQARAFWILAAGGAVVLALALGAAHYLEEHGHIATGMNNQVVWGLPHVFAIFLIVAASGALNVASIASVFAEPAYKPSSPLSVLLSMALLAGGLMVLVLDLGRPERLVVAATHYNFRSIFAWNMILYNGLFVICALYLWMLLERRFTAFAKPVGLAAFAWRIILTTGTGSIFGFLVSRQAYASGVIAPLFIALSLAWGLAVFHLAQLGFARLAGRPVDEALQARLRRLLGVFVIAVLYFVAVHHLTNLYWAKQAAFERFILVSGAPYPALFWAGFVILGSAVPLALVLPPSPGRPALGRLGIGAGDARRLRLSLRVHHRGAGVPARDLPRLRGDERAPRRPHRSLRAERSGIPAGSGRCGRLPPHRARRRARIADHATGGGGGARCRGKRGSQVISSRIAP